MARIGIYGGNFNPFHNGHIHCIFSVAKEQELDHIFVIPNQLSPGKAMIEGASAEDRVAMVKTALQGFQEVATVDEQEVIRGGVSYTIDTLKNYLKEYAPDEIYLIVGMDAFLSFDTWKKYEEILESCNLVVVARPGYERPFTKADLPVGIQPLVEEFYKDQILIKSGRMILFQTVEEMDVAATEVRRKLRIGQKVDAFLPAPVMKYIEQNKIYRPSKERISDLPAFTTRCAQFLQWKGGIQVRAFDLAKTEYPSANTIIVSGTSTRSTTAMAENLAKFIKEEVGLLPLSFEGTLEGRWVLVDYGDLTVHCFYDHIRSEYRMEELWRKGKELPIPPLDLQTFVKYN